MQNFVWQHAHTLELCGMQPLCSPSQECNKGLLSNLRSGRWAPRTGPHKMLIAQNTNRIFLPNRRLLRQCFDEQITMGIGMTCSTTEGPQACHACSTRSLYTIIAKQSPICFDRLAKQHRVGNEKKHNHRYDYPGHVYNWISVEPGTGYTRYPDMPGANTPAPII